jgi:PAS domain-containing protein
MNAYQHIFECVPEALLVIDAAGRIQEVNARAE